MGAPPELLESITNLDLEVQKAFEGSSDERVPSTTLNTKRNKEAMASWRAFLSVFWAFGI